MGLVPTLRTVRARVLRHNTIEIERRIWSRLRRRQVDGWKFRRQHPIGPYFVDFYCPAAKLVIEFNGLSHDDDRQWAYDQRRQAWLEAQGIASSI